MKTKELNSSMLCNPKKIFPTSHRGILQMKKQYLDKISNKNKAINFFPIRKSYEKAFGPSDQKLAIFRFLQLL
jgi:hypothetical protein